jgi:hypothetical protein
MLFPKSLADDAQAVTDAIFVGDSKKLFSYTYDEEKNALGWTPSKVDEFYGKLIAPRLARSNSHLVQRKYVNTSMGVPSQGVVYVIVNGAPGVRPVAMAIFVDQTDTGPHMSLIHLLRDAWRIEYYLDHPKAEFTPWNNFQARKIGYLKDKQQLLALHLPGLFDEKNPNEPFTWPKFEQDLKDFESHNGPNGPLTPKATPAGADGS